jgi:hypothetical protein
MLYLILVAGALLVLILVGRQDARAARARAIRQSHSWED